MDNTTRTRKKDPDLKTGLVGLLAFGAGAVGLIWSLVGLFFIGVIAWLGLRFVIGLFGILFS